MVLSMPVMPLSVESPSHNFRSCGLSLNGRGGLPLYHSDDKSQVDLVDESIHFANFNRSAPSKQDKA